jgi:hypothetical protein
MKGDIMSDTQQDDPTGQQITEALVRMVKNIILAGIAQSPRENDERARESLELAIGMIQERSEKINPFHTVTEVANTIHADFHNLFQSPSDPRYTLCREAIRLALSATDKDEAAPARREKYKTAMERASYRIHTERSH